tara:strand:+ start:185 stop:412 length:228 start_codon:yes stop_codon:yes gene_type:complete
MNRAQIGKIMEEKGYSDFITTAELAKRWRKSHRTLENWRVEGYGPSYSKIGGTVLYKIRDIEDFEKESSIQKTKK